ncbi:MAG: CRISPR-associated protein Cas4 [Anaerolineales bacterium]|nr:CRISPR-associated protein Cas4 [Anaerolineales bacterium]
MLYIALFLIIFAFFFFRKSATQQKEAGLPGGRIIYSDTRGWGKVEQPLFYAALELTGKPDYLIEQGDQIIPVEVKSGSAPETPYDSHIYQLAAYCLLVEKTYNRRPSHGIIHYENRDFAIDYTRELEQSLIDLLVEMKRDEHNRKIPRSHESPARCVKCGFREVCDQKL